jgi:signal transduction histidine kinase
MPFKVIHPEYKIDFDSVRPPNLDMEVTNGARIENNVTLLTLVMQNLLGNAVRYSSSGTIKLLA